MYSLLVWSGFPIHHRIAGKNPRSILLPFKVSFAEINNFRAAPPPSSNPHPTTISNFMILDNLILLLVSTYRFIFTVFP